MKSADTHPIEWLMEWYQAQCDGDWEHQNGVKIGTIDNPGWSLDIDLVGTPYADNSDSQTMLERSDSDWTFVEVKNGKFRARGGSGNLAELISKFAQYIALNAR
jgi:hypothetical protein